MTEEQRSQRKNDEKARATFALDTMFEIKLDNIDQAMNIFQSVHMHSRLKNWQVNIPVSAYYGDASGQTFYVDLLNMHSTGDVETLCKCLEWGVVDDMSLSYHWVSVDRLAAMVSKLKLFLGWA